MQMHLHQWKARNIPALLVLGKYCTVCVFVCVYTCHLLFSQDIILKFASALSVLFLYKFFLLFCYRAWGCSSNSMTFKINILLTLQTLVGIGLLVKQIAFCHVLQPQLIYFYSDFDI